MFRPLFQYVHGSPVGVIGYGRFTPAERDKFQFGDPEFHAAVKARVAAVPPPKSREEMYNDLFGGM